jgi:NIMA (never in mitosis gene a)-related kinase
VQSKSENEGFLAIKIIKMANLNEKEKDSALNEIRLLASIDSPNVISYHNAFFDSKASTLNIVMEYADGGDLAGMIKRKR